MAPVISKKAIFDTWYSNMKTNRFDAAYAFILQEYGDTDLSEDFLKCIKDSLRSLCQQIEMRWKKCSRNHDRFLKYNGEWLEGNVNLPEALDEPLPSTSKDPDPLRYGRPSKSFTELSEKTRRRKLKSFVQSTSPDEIVVAAEMKMRELGKKDSAAIIKELAQASPSRGTKIKRARLAYTREIKTISPNQALAMIIDANLSTHQYNIIRAQANQVARNMYPSYNAIKQAKHNCYPSDINITELSVEISLQSLIDHTILRLCTAQKEVFESVPDSCQDLYFIVKWGCDGSQQSRYKQKFTTEGGSDENLFSISMVPLQLYFINEETKKIIWQNPTSSSTRYCRPIKFMFAKESSELISAEVSKIEQQVDSLNPTEAIIDKKHFSVKPVLILSMIDGKVCSALSMYSSSQACFVCGATPKDMNRPEVIQTKTIYEKVLTFGLSPLHSWIRFMECILHIAYRIPVKVWQARGAKIKNIVNDRKKLIQNRFKDEMGLLVDFPVQQAGNSNDGNTARRFFRDAEKSAEITGVNLELIQRFRVILETLNCGFSINEDTFEEYANDTRNLYLKHYSWYYMPSSVHKVLYHGKLVIASCILPIGQLPEEAQEARNKDNRKYRELFTRKTSRVHTNTDLIHRLLISSDPLLASLRHTVKKKKGSITREVLSLLSEPSLESTESTESTEDDGDSDSE